MYRFWNEEHIFKIGKLVFAHMFDEPGMPTSDEELFFDSDGNEYKCGHLFWKFYWIKN